jgi:hypothetical protein
MSGLHSRKAGVKRFRRRPNPVGPIVQDEDPLGVVRPRVRRVLDNEPGVQAVVRLQTMVRMEPLRA